MLSGGVDSTVLLQAVRGGVTKRVAAVFSAFGQDASERQRSYASRLCNRLGVPFHVVEAPQIFHVDIGASDPPHIRQEESRGSQGNEAMVAFIAARLGFRWVYSGLTFTDAARWPDVDYRKTEAAVNALLEATSSPTRIARPYFSAGGSDSDVLRYAEQEHLEYNDTWSCWWGLRFHCGQCQGCQKRKGVFADLGIVDQTRYLGNWPDLAT
jgi:7-cyano-7-deazaguanine synthase